ncbi:phage tail tape measure protein [Shinella sp.]|uniref:phage tail tape measure protein n=1 Tax=Shinella sp. TaxID=1870904 RepID=UPI003F72B731
MASLSSVLKLTLLDGVTGPARRIQGVLSNFQRQQTSMLAPMRGIGGQLLAFGAGYLGVTKGISGTVGAAIEFESAFADVRKVVDASDEQFQNMSRTIKSMSRELPMTSVEIAQLFAAAGESGVATTDLKAFAEMAARVGIAFDMSAGEAGESLAKLKTQLGLSVAETGDMADAINHLSNNMASKAKDITEYMLRVGSLAEMGGFAKEEIAAIGSAMIAAGAQAETAGTAMQNVVKKMSAGSFAKKEQRDAAKALGLDLPTIAKQMQKDAPAALKTVLKALAKAPKDQQIALLSQFFGDEAKAFAPLIGNIGLLDQALDSVANKTNYSGSAFREYVARAGTTANALQILRNKIAYVFEDMGAEWLPTIKDGVAAIGSVLDTLGSRAGIFDEMKYGLKGFMQGLGFDGGVKEAIESLGDLLFGKVDGEGSADRLGRVFKQFEGYGESIRQMKKDFEDNPIVKFFSDLSPYYLDVLKWTIGFALVAGAIRKLAGALWLLSGASTVFGAIKALAGIAGALGLAGVDLPDGDGKKKPKGGKPPGKFKGSVPFSPLTMGLAGVTGFAALMGWGAENLKNDPARQERDNKKSAQNIQALKSLLGLGGNDNSSHPYRDGNYDDGGRGASMDAYLRTPETKPAATTGSPVRVDQLLAGLQGKPMSLDAGTIGQLLGPTRGVSDVRVTNKERPNITVHAPVTITNISSPQDAVDAAASRLGQRIKAEIEAADTD